VPAWRSAGSTDARDDQLEAAEPTEPAGAWGRAGNLNHN
jgi:hypothetical protein